MPAWPADLPQEFETEGFEDRPGESLVRGRFASTASPSRSLNLFVDDGTIVGFMRGTADQWAALIAFYENTLADGALAFDFPDPDDTADTIVVSFMEPPRLDTIGGDFHSMGLVLERQG